MGKMVKDIDFKKLRDFISHIYKKRDRVLIKLIYLGAFRVSEIVTRANPYDLENKKSKPYGRYLDWKIADFKINNRIKHKVLLIKAAIAKRKLKRKAEKEMGYIPKNIALPCDPVFEPFTEELLRWVLKHNVLNFPLTRRSVHRIVKENLRELDQDVTVHTLRHWRITHLLDKYGFEPTDLVAYAGWTVTSSFAQLGIKVHPMLNTYYHAAWRKYFPRLLVPIQEVL